MCFVEKSNILINASLLYRKVLKNLRNLIYALGVSKMFELVSSATVYELTPSLLFSNDFFDLLETHTCAHDFIFLLIRVLWKSRK